MAAKKKTTKKKPAGAHMQVVELGPTADNRGRLYGGSIVEGRNVIDLGTLVAPTKTEARKRFSALAHKRLA